MCGCGIVICANAFDLVEAASAKLLLVTWLADIGCKLEGALARIRRGSVAGSSARCEAGSAGLDLGTIGGMKLAGRGSAMEVAAAMSVASGFSLSSSKGSASKAAEKAGRPDGLGAVGANAVKKLRSLGCT